MMRRKKFWLALGLSLSVTVVVVVTVSVSLVILRKKLISSSSSTSGTSSSSSSSSSSSLIQGMFMDGSKYMLETETMFNFAGVVPFRIDVVAKVDTASIFIAGYHNSGVGTNWYMAVDESGRFQLHRETTLGSIDILSNILTTIADNISHTYSYVYDGQNILALVDGVIVASNISTVEQVPLTAPISVGGSQISGGWTNIMQGTLYSLKIYSSATADPTNLVGSFTLDNTQTLVPNGASGATDGLTVVDLV